MDMGSYTPSIFNCGISVWNKWTLLVCCWGKHPNSSFRNFGHRVKRKAPSSHTFPEIIYARFGKYAHKVFLSFALLTNTIVTAMLVLGDAAVINSLTGINVYVACLSDTCGRNNLYFFWRPKGNFFC